MFTSGKCVLVLLCCVLAVNCCSDIKRRRFSYKHDDYDDSCEWQCPKTTYLFPRRSTTDYIRVKTPWKRMDEFTICTRLKGYGEGVLWGTVISYATPENTNYFVILFDFRGNTLYLSILGDVKSGIAHPLKAGRENFMCFVFGRSEGFGRIYYNGTLHDTLSFTNRDPIPPGGAFVIGQDQDQYVGGFEEKQSIHGELYNYMIWDRALSDAEIYKMYQFEDACAPGHWLALTPDNIQLEGGVNAI